MYRMLLKAHVYGLYRKRMREHYNYTMGESRVDFSPQAHIHLETKRMISFAYLKIIILFFQL